VVDYLLLKKVHLCFAAISISGFIIRWIWRMKDSPAGQRRFVRIAPHVIDTLFLASGVVLALSIQQYPLKNPWLTAKVFGLLGYILLGMAAMSQRLPRPIRGLAFVSALVVFCWIISVAWLKSPWGFLGI
jgi:uncharacterized membrane protein SirB2